jgi:predicted secreted protein
MPLNEKLPLLLLGCVLMLIPASHAQVRGPIVITERDADTTLKVSVRDIVVVRLAAIPANGYVWHVAYSSAVSETEKTRYELLEKGQPGARAVQIFHFLIRKAGQHELHFTYGRGESIVRTCNFRLDAR